MRHDKMNYYYMYNGPDGKWYNLNVEKYIIYI